MHHRQQSLLLEVSAMHMQGLLHAPMSEGAVHILYNAKIVFLWTTHTPCVTPNAPSNVI